MAVSCLDQRRDDTTSGRPYISWPLDHVLFPFRSQECPKPQTIQVPSNNEKLEKSNFDEHFPSKCVRKCGEESDFAPQRRTERLRVALGERVERSKDALKKTISASKNMMKTAITFPHLCGRKSNTNKFPNEATCPCARYVKVSRNHSLATTNDSTADLHKQLKGTGHLSRNWQQPDSRPTSVDVRKINLSSRCKSYQYVSYSDGNVDIEPVANTAVCKYGEGIDEIHPSPRERKSIRHLFRR